MVYKIGDFSKLVEMPVSTLRYYDEIGVLKPSRIDRYSGYRYYSDQEYDKAMLIKDLLFLGFSLEEIIMYQDALTEEVIQNKINELRQAVETTLSKIDILEGMKQVYGSGKVMQLTQSKSQRRAA